MWCRLLYFVSYRVYVGMEGGGHWSLERDAWRRRYESGGKEGGGIDGIGLAIVGVYIVLSSPLSPLVSILHYNCIADC